MNAGETNKYLHYSMLIEWSNETNVFIVTVPELHGCRTHGETYEEAAQQGREAIEGWIASAIADGEPVLKPRIYATSMSVH